MTLALSRPLPIVGAPMAGGVSTPELVAAVSGAGGLGCLPAGYLTADRAREQIARVRELTDEPFGLNIFVPGSDDADPAQISGYARALEPEAARLGVRLGEPRFDDDAYGAKLALALQERPALVSFTFGCPGKDAITRLRAAGIEVAVTVTCPEEAAVAVASGADSLILQGVEAGGHRGCFNDGDGQPELGLGELLAAVARSSAVPCVAAGGIMDHEGVTAALNGGAQAVQVGTALLLATEAGTAQAHRDALGSDAGTRLTRAFTGRTARGIVNRFIDEHDHQAVRGYPQVHHLTAPIRAAAKAHNERSALHLWAGAGYRRARAAPAAEIVAALVGAV